MLELGGRGLGLQGGSQSAPRPLGFPGLESWETELCEAVMAERLASFGYVLRPTALPPVQHLARYTTVTAHRRLAARKRSVWDRGLRAGEPQPVASRLGVEPVKEKPAWSMPKIS